MDVPAKIEEIEQLIRTARAMPMSSSCVVNRTELLDHLTELRSLLPDELAGAQRVLADSAAVVQEGRSAAEQLIDQAREEQARLISETEVARVAEHEAVRILAQARADAKRMQTQVDDYVDTKLANFEVVLHKTLKAVERGRSKISGRHELADLAEGQVDEQSGKGHPGALGSANAGGERPDLDDRHAAYYAGRSGRSGRSSRREGPRAQSG